MISKMHRIEVVGPTSMLDPVLTVIQGRGVMHIEEIPLAEYGEKELLHRVALPEPRMAERTQLEGLIELLDDATNHIPQEYRQNIEESDAYAVHYKAWEQSDIGTVGFTARSMHAKVRSFARRHRNVTDDLQALSLYEEVVSTLTPLVETHELTPEYEFVGIIVDQKSRMSRDLFTEELRRLTAGMCDYYEGGLSNRRVAALIGYHRSHAEAVRAFIIEAGIGQMNVPRYLRGKPFEEALADLQQDLEDLHRRKAKLEEQSGVYYRDRVAELVALLHVCRDRYARYVAISTIATTRYAFVMRGWVPGKAVNGLSTALKDAAGESVVMRRLKVGRFEKPPVLLDNPKPFKPFEPLLSLFPLPLYGSVDPTVYIGSIFPPIFGLMLGDVGYGALVGLGALIVGLIGRSSPLARKLSIVAGWCAGFSILFGFVFGELFGDLGHEIFGLTPLWQPRFSFTGENKAETLLGYMAIAIAIGLFHVLLGLVLGIINYHRSGERHMVVENSAKIAGIFVMLFFAGRLAKLLPPIFTHLGIAALVAFVVLMTYQVMHKPIHGLMLPLEMLTTLGNILSYVRIMAIGLVSVVLAFLANMFGGIAGNVVLAVIIAVLVHALNLALGIIDPTIQGLRLHYVEFFSKFFVGGGKPYTPFRKIGGITV